MADLSGVSKYITVRSQLLDTNYVLTGGGLMDECRREQPEVLNHARVLGTKCSSHGAIASSQEALLSY